VRTLRNFAFVLLVLTVITATRTARADECGSFPACDCQYGFGDDFYADVECDTWPDQCLDIYPSFCSDVAGACEGYCSDAGREVRYTWCEDAGMDCYAVCQCTPQM
jgi:hypothetical protein